MESTINAMLPYAIEAIKNNKLIFFTEKDVQSVDDKKNIGKIKSIYESYLCQFGPMVVQLGLRSTLAVYKNKSESSKGNRAYILDLIWEIINKNDFKLSSIKDSDNSKTCIERLIANKNEINNNDEQLILDASVALKRAIRTFLLTDDKNN